MNPPFWGFRCKLTFPDSQLFIRTLKNCVGPQKFAIKTIPLVITQWNILYQPGLVEAKIQWDDEDDSNSNSYTGQVPDGVYGGNTLIKYCCRTDGYATNAINLPTDKSFVLFKSNTNLCQKVNKMRESEGYFRWDSEDDNPSSLKQGPINVELDSGKNIKLHYCYYSPSK